MIQEQFINKLLESKDALVIKKYNITEDCFPEHFNEYSFIKEHLDTYGNIPDKETFFNKFVNFPHLAVSEPIEYLKDELLHEKQKTIAINYVQNELKTAILQDADLIPILNTLVSKVSQTTKLETVDLFSAEELKERYDVYCDKIENKDKYFYSTGFPEIDQDIGGLDRAGEYSVTFGRTNAGKSLIVQKRAIENYRRGLRVGYYSGEMTKLQMGYRGDTMISGISNMGMIQGDSIIQKNLEYAYRNVIPVIQKQYPNACFKLLEASKLGRFATVDDLEAFINAEKLDILFVDQQSTMEDRAHSKNPIDKAANISRELKQLQIKTGIAIDTAVQQNRGSTETGIDTKNIAGSDRIAQDSTFILSVEQDPERHLLILEIIKSRVTRNHAKYCYYININTGQYIFMPNCTKPDEASEMDLEEAQQKAERNAAQLLAYGDSEEEQDIF